MTRDRKTDANTKRWKVETTYHDRPVQMIYVEEIKELQAVVEHGPDWNLLDHITITLNRRS